MKSSLPVLFRSLKLLGAISLLTIAGCAKEAPPATPPALPPMPPPPANQGASAQRYQQLMQQQPPKGAKVPVSGN